MLQPLRQEPLVTQRRLPESNRFDPNHHTHNSEHIANRHPLPGDMADDEIEEHACLPRA